MNYAEVVISPLTLLISLICLGGGLKWWSDYKKTPTYDIRSAERHKQGEGRILKSETEEISELQAWQMINPDVLLILEFQDDEVFRAIPVVYTPEDRDKYYRLDIYGQNDSMGTAFLDDNSNPDGQNLIVNGHSSLTKDKVFTFLKKYTDQKYFSTHPDFKMMDGTGEHTYQIVKVSEFDLTAELLAVDLYGGWLAGSFRDDQDVIEMFEAMQPYTLQERDFDYHGEDMITLITCDMNKEDSRYVIQAIEIHRDYN